MDFAPLDKLEDQILAQLRKRHTRVSVERICAGPGILAIYEALAEIEGKSVQRLDDKAVWTMALEGSDSLAAAALDRFCLALGAVAGDLALAHGPKGVVIAGGLGLRIKDALKQSGFRQPLRRQGALSDADGDDPGQADHPSPARPVTARRQPMRRSIPSDDIDDIMRTAPVIPVLVVEDAATARPLAEALVAGGLRVLEVTLRTAAALDVIREMKKVEGAIVGAGTVVNEGQFADAVDAGAEFIVSPGLTAAAGRGHRRKPRALSARHRQRRRHHARDGTGP